MSWFCGTASALYIVEAPAIEHFPTIASGLLTSPVRRPPRVCGTPHLVTPLIPCVPSIAPVHIHIFRLWGRDQTSMPCECSAAVLFHRGGHNLPHLHPPCPPRRQRLFCSTSSDACPRSTTTSLPATLRSPLSSPCSRSSVGDSPFIERRARTDPAGPPGASILSGFVTHRVRLDDFRSIQHLRQINLPRLYLVLLFFTAYVVSP